MSNIAHKDDIDCTLGSYACMYQSRNVFSLILITKGIIYISLDIDHFSDFKKETFMREKYITIYAMLTGVQSGIQSGVCPRVQLGV